MHFEGHAPIRILSAFETKLSGYHSYRAACHFIRLPVIALIIGRLAIANHKHDIGEDCARSIVLVCIKEDSETFEVVFGTEDGTLLGSVFCNPHREAISIEVPSAMNLEFKFNLQLPSVLYSTHYIR